MKFEEKKEQLIKLAKEKKACCDEFKKLLKCESDLDLLNLIAYNFDWCYKNEVISVPFLLNFEKETRIESGIYVNHKYNIELTKSIYVIANDFSQISEVIAYGSSKISEVRTYGSSKISEVRTYDFSQIKYISPKN